CVELRSPDVELHLGCAKPRRPDSLERCLVSMYSLNEHAESVVRSLENRVEDSAKSSKIPSVQVGRSNYVSIGKFQEDLAKLDRERQMRVAAENAMSELQVSLK
ncbi:hypothetical protein V8G54_001120, partial [Vigna mungo]